MKKGRFTNLKVMDYLVFICIMAVLIYTSITLYFYYTKNIPTPTDISNRFFAFITIELSAMALISITDNLSQNRLEKYEKTKFQYKDIKNDLKGE